jgi:hypothetical protein
VITVDRRLIMAKLDRLAPRLPPRNPLALVVALGCLGGYSAVPTSSRGAVRVQLASGWGVRASGGTTTTHGSQEGVAKRVDAEPARPGMTT